MAVVLNASGVNRVRFTVINNMKSLFHPQREIHYIGGTDILPPPLEPEEEAYVLSQLDTRRSEEAKALLIERNLRLVVYIAKKFENTGIGVEDLISIGTIGLIKAIQTFKLDKKIKFCNTLTNYVVDLKDAGKSIIISGDVNIAHMPIDLKNPEKNHENSGFLPAERDWLSEFLDLGFIDTFRYLHPQEEKYSWWSYRYNAREKGIGWRLDYFFVSEDLKNSVVSATIEDNVMGSDHCPITLELDL